MHWVRFMAVGLCLTVGLLLFAILLTSSPPGVEVTMREPRSENGRPVPLPSESTPQAEAHGTLPTLLPPSPFPRNPWPDEAEIDPVPLDRSGSAGSPEAEQEPDRGPNHPSPAPEMPASETVPVHAAAAPVHKAAPAVHKRRPPATQARLAVPHPPPPAPDTYAPVSTWRAPPTADPTLAIPWRWPTAMVRMKPADHDWRSRALGGAL